MIKSKKDRMYRLIMFLILAVMTLIIILPYIWMLSNSFKTTKETLTDPSHLIPVNFTLDGYKSVLFGSPFFKWLGNSLLITCVTAAAVLLTSTMVGYLFSKYRFRGKQFLFMIILATMMVPAQTTMVPSFIIINELGLYDRVWAVIIPACINAFGIYLCKQFCDEIPRELIESAKIDGAGDFKVFFHIVIPQIKPAIGALGIFTFLDSWNDYLHPLLYLASTEKMTLPLALSYFSSQHTSNLSATMAAAALIMVPVGIVFVIFQKQFIKSIALTGMK